MAFSRRLNEVLSMQKMIKNIDENFCIRKFGKIYVLCQKTSENPLKNGIFREDTESYEFIVSPPIKTIKETMNYWREVKRY